MLKNLKSKCLVLILAPLIMGAAPCTTPLAELLSGANSSKVSDKDLVEAYKELFSSLSLVEVKSLSGALQKKKSWAEILRGDLKKAHLLKSFEEAYSTISEVRKVKEHHKILNQALKSLLKSRKSKVQKKDQVKKRRATTQIFRKRLFSNAKNDIRSISWSDDGKWIAVGGEDDFINLIPAKDNKVKPIRVNVSEDISIDEIANIQFLPKSLDLVVLSDQGEFFKISHEAPDIWNAKKLGWIDIDGTESVLKASPVDNRFALTGISEFAGLFHADNPKPLQMLNMKAAEKKLKKGNEYILSADDSTFLANGEWRVVTAKYRIRDDHFHIKIYGEGRSSPHPLETFRISDLSPLGTSIGEGIRRILLLPDQRKLFLQIYDEANQVLILNLGDSPGGQKVRNVEASQFKVIDGINELQRVEVSPDGKIIALADENGKFNPAFRTLK